MLLVINVGLIRIKLEEMIFVIVSLDDVFVILGSVCEFGVLLDVIVFGFICY